MDHLDSLGNTAEFNSEDIFLRLPFFNFKPNGLSKSSPIIIKPPLGPRNVLCVVVVTIWQCGNGSFKIPLAINPAGCEISAIKIAPTLSAITLKRLKSISREYAEAPAIINLRLFSLVATS